MRPIKFRAWGGVEQKYFVYFDLMDEQGDDYFTDETQQPDGSHHILRKSNIEAIQQFTGLLDKNGKEIYEGDIVRLVYRHSEGGGWYSNEPVEQGKVYFDTHWGVKFDCSDYTQRTAKYWKEASERDVHDVEVIGNIYENGDLLKWTKLPPEGLEPGS